LRNLTNIGGLPAIQYCVPAALIFVLYHGFGYVGAGLVPALSKTTIKESQFGFFVIETTYLTVYLR
jgi:hypothetical protein